MRSRVQKLCYFSKMLKEVLQERLAKACNILIKTASNILTKTSRSRSYEISKVLSLLKKFHLYQEIDGQCVVESVRFLSVVKLLQGMFDSSVFQLIISKHALRYVHSLLPVFIAQLPNSEPIRHENIRPEVAHQSQSVQQKMVSV